MGIPSVERNRQIGVCQRQHLDQFDARLHQCSRTVRDLWKGQTPIGFVPGIEVRMGPRPTNKLEVVRECILSRGLRDAMGPLEIAKTGPHTSTTSTSYGALPPTERREKWM